MHCYAAFVITGHSNHSNQDLYRYLILSRTFCTQQFRANKNDSELDTAISQLEVMLLREGHVYMPALFNLSYAQLSYDIIIALTSLKLYIFSDVLLV